MTEEIAAAVLACKEMMRIAQAVAEFPEPIQNTMASSFFMGWMACLGAYGENKTSEEINEYLLQHFFFKGWSHLMKHISN